MTQNEKKISNSEITTTHPLPGEAVLYGFTFETHYAILSGHNSRVYVSPVDGFVNVLVVEGNGTSSYVVNNLSYIVRGGENRLHPIQIDHLFEWKSLSEDNIVILLFVPFAVLGEFHIHLAEQRERFDDVFLTISDQRINLVVKQLLDLSQQPSHLDKLRVQSLIMELLAHQIEGFYAENEEHDLIENKSHYDKILLAKKIIEKDLSKNYTIRQLAKEVGTNEQYLKRYFKQYFGKTVMNYITDVKMEHAKNLIMTGEYRISDVARLTGYKHSTHFTTAFKKFFGFIPNSLRYTFLVAQQGAQIVSEIENFINIL